MAPRSDRKGFIAVPTTMADDNKPISTGRHRFLVDDGLHLADQCGRVLCNMVFATPVRPATPAVGEYSEIFTFGPFRLTVGPDGVAYPIRVRIAGQKDAKAGTVSFRIVFGSAARVKTYFNSGGANMTDVTSAISGTTNAWRATDSTLLTLTAAQTAECLTTDSISDASGSYRDVIAYKGVIGVFGQTTTSSAEAELGGLYAAEFVGD